MISRTSLWITLALAVMHAATGVAKPPDPAAREAAKQEFAKGNELFINKDYAAALTRFQAAHQLFPHRSFVFNMAVCAENLERWKAAGRFFDEFAKMVGPDDPEHAEGVKRAEAARTKYRSSLVTVGVDSVPRDLQATLEGPGGINRCNTPCELTVEAGVLKVAIQRGEITRRSEKRVPPGGRWTVREDLTTLAAGEPRGTLVTEVDVPGAVIVVDGKTVPGVAEIPLAPGTYKVVVSHRTYRSQTYDVVVQAFKSTELDAHLLPESIGRGQRIAGWTTLGLGGALLINGAIFAALAQNANDQASKLADDTTPSLENEAQLDTLKKTTNTRALVADVSFGLAAAATAAGLVLWLTAPGPPAAAAAAPAGEAGRMTIVRF